MPINQLPNGDLYNKINFALVYQAYRSPQWDETEYLDQEGYPSFKSNHSMRITKIEITTDQPVTVSLVTLPHEVPSKEIGNWSLIRWAEYTVDDLHLCPHQYFDVRTTPLDEAPKKITVILSGFLRKPVNK